MGTRNLKLAYLKIGMSTKKAIQFYFGETRFVWIPKSQIKENNLIDGFLILPEWLIKEKKIEKYIW